jgi:hypothetical protein
LKKYRRIEVNAFRRRVTIVSGEWQRDIPPEIVDAPPAHNDDGVSLNDIDLCEPVQPDSPEGQLILVEAVRTLERRLSPEARATVYTCQQTFAPDRSNRNGCYFKLQSLYQLICPRLLRFARKEK